MSSSVRIENILAERERALLASNVCLRCGAAGAPRVQPAPCAAVELMVWCFGLALALFGELTLLALAPCYSVWRRCTTHRACASCGARHTLVPGTSPKGRAELVSQGLLE